MIRLIRFRASYRTQCTSASAIAGKLLRDLPAVETLRLLARLSPLAIHAQHTHAHLTKRRITTNLTPSEADMLRKTHEKHTLLSRIAALHDELVSVRDATDDDDEDMKALFQEETRTLQTRLAEMCANMSASLLEEEDVSDAPAATLLEIRAGTGGEEAALFVSDLQAMYTKLFERRKWRWGVLHASKTGRGGLREVVMRVGNKAAYDGLRLEAGVHRVQRVPVTDTTGRIHTSTAAVSVLRDEGEQGEMSGGFDKDEVRVDVYRASGAGGQHVNKTESAVRITHIETGIIATSQEERSQHRNRAIAMGILVARVAERERAERELGRRNERRGQLGRVIGERSDRIRTYNFGQRRVTDHRVGVGRIVGGVLPSAEVGGKGVGLDSILNGGVALDEIIEGVKRAMVFEQVETLLMRAEEWKEVKEVKEAEKLKEMLELEMKQFI